MASSRLEKIGTIYSRLTGLLQSGALKEVDTPIWYNVYKAFPPKYEPKYDRPSPNISVKNIFYLEDNARAWFHKQNKLGIVDMADLHSSSTSQKFIIICNQLNEDESIPKETLYERAMEVLKTEGQLSYQKHKVSQEIDSSNSSIATSYIEAKRESKSSNNATLDLKDIFKE